MEMWMTLRYEHRYYDDQYIVNVRQFCVTKFSVMHILRICNYLHTMWIPCATSICLGWSGKDILQTTEFFIAIKSKLLSFVHKYNMIHSINRVISLSLMRNIRQYLWDVTTCPCPWYMLLANNPDLTPTGTYIHWNLICWRAATWDNDASHLTGFMWHYGYSRINIVVADRLQRIWLPDICNYMYQDDVGPLAHFGNTSCPRAE